MNYLDTLSSTTQAFLGCFFGGFTARICTGLLFDAVLTRANGGR